MTINQAIYSTLDGTNISTDDFPVTKRFIYEELKTTRNELIKQELNKNVLLDSNSMQTIQCFKLVRTDSAACGCITSGEYYLRSEDELPKAIIYNSGLAVFPYTMNGVMINPIDKDQWSKRFRKRFKLNDTFGFYISNNRIVVVGFDDVEELDIYLDGHFSDPEAVYLLNGDEGCEDGCKPVYELPFICPSHIERRVIEIARSVVLRKLGIPSDNSNNAKFDPNVQSKEQPSA